MEALAGSPEDLAMHNVSGSPELQTPHPVLLKIHGVKKHRNTPKHMPPAYYRVSLTFTPKSSGRHEDHRLLDDVAGEAGKAGASTKHWLAPVWMKEILDELVCIISEAIESAADVVLRCASHPRRTCY